jgi:hypothetical protein
MSCKRITALSVLSALTVAGLLGCGRKESPKPPIQIIPARTIDLVVQQRGWDLLLSLGYPLTTISGTALGGIQAVELWEFNREIPIATFVAPEDEEIGESVEGEGAGEEAEGAAEIGADAPEESEAKDPESDETGTEQAEPRVVTLDEIRDSALDYPEGINRLEDLVIPDPAEFGASALLRLVLQGPELASAISGDRIRTRITLPELDQRQELDVRAFAVKTLSNTGRGSAFSNLGWVVRRDPPPPPQGDGIELRWTYAGKGPAPDPAPISQEASAAEGATLAALASPATIEVEEIVDDGGIEAFHIYRRSARSPSYEAPLRRVEKLERTFVDRSAAFGESYVYAVASVLRTGPLVESALSTEREVDYEDRFAPAPPRNLVTFADRSSVRLLWDASDTSDVAGYFVERRAEGAADWVTLNAEQVAVLEYTDRQVATGRTYFYRVLAVDQNGLKGDPSASTEVRVP